MNSKRLVELILVLVLWYFLAGMVLGQVLHVLPPGYDREAFFLAGAALPWSLLLLDFLAPPRSALGGVVEQVLFLVLTAGAIAVNAWLLNQAVVQAMRMIRIRRAGARRPTPRGAQVPVASSDRAPDNPRTCARGSPRRGPVRPR
ncbi:hypothetical protein [uncultured Thiodictyon sp.]|uniref:hypothetical protein n=1 Tax=uncultured Thiodictyon sp. TaxID=1846217 RepID=UPI0025F56110|nr:hypothetical protein [uncultured Thiodictyon sp.]